MPLKKSVTIVLATIVLITSFVSAYFVLNIFFGSAFEIKSWNVMDDEGFPSLSYNYTCSDYVVVKMFDLNSNLVDTDNFLAGEDSKIICFGSYKQTITPGSYTLKAYDKDGDELFLKSFHFNGPDLSISSCDQKWWVNGDDTILIGLSFTVFNSGDTPIYPYSIDIKTNSESFSGLVLPATIASGKAKSIDCVVYKKGSPASNSFTVEIKDIDGRMIASSSFAFDVKNSISTKYFTKGVPKKISVPYPEFLYNYYSNLERISENDYSYYVFDPYDDLYIDLFIDRLISALTFGETAFNAKSDYEKIDFIADFVQNLEYKEDVIINGSSEYPNYPIETFFNRKYGCDCEDKSILTASLLDRLNYSVALFRLPNHMSVGVKLGQNAVPGRDYYYEDYYYLETTTEAAPLGFIPTQYRNSVSELEVYEISDRPYLTHEWINNVLTIYTKTEFGNFVKMDAVVENYGRTTAENIVVKGVFVSNYGFEINSNSISVSSLEPGKKKKVTLSVDIPSVTTTFESRIIYGGKTVDTKESSTTFPT